MNTGLAILIARTKTHPEEFTGYFPSDMSSSKWVIAIENFQQCMTDEEKAAWEEAKKELDKWYLNKRRDDFTEFVMKELAGAGDDDGVSLTSVSHNDINPLTSRIRMQDRYATGLADPVQMYDQRDALRNAYQNNPYQGMGQQPLRVSTQSDESNSLYSVPSLQKASDEGNLLSNFAKSLGFK
jgi:hypothetical protein